MIMLKPIILTLSLIAGLVLPQSAAFAQTAEVETEDLFIDADHQDIDYKEKNSYFSGNVIVRKGTMTIMADELFVETDSDGAFKKLTAKGKPAKFSQLGEDSLDISSEALEITYLVATEVLTFKEQATLKQGGSEVTGDLIKFDLLAQRVKAESDENDDSRVTTRLKVKKN